MMDKLEKIQRDYTLLIPEIRHLEYHERLKIMNLTSLQRRIDRYRIFYIRKILQGKVPECGINIRRDEKSRNGLMLEVPTKKNQHKLRTQSFQVRGPEIFNCLPPFLREIELCKDTYKQKLDNYLSLLDDIPRISAGSKLHSNNLDTVIMDCRTFCTPKGGL